MKITQSKNAQKAIFYKDSNNGRLVVIDNTVDETEDVINELDFKRSYIGKILVNAENGKNPFKDFVTILVENKNLKPNLINSVISEEGLISLISKNITRIGRNLRYSQDSPTLETLLIKYYNNENIEDDFKLLQERIQSKIVNRKRYLKTSIYNNSKLQRIPKT